MSDWLCIGLAAGVAASATVPADAQPLTLGTYAGALQAATSNGRTISGVALASFPNFELALIKVPASGACTLTTAEVNNLAANQTRGLSASVDFGCMETNQGTYDYCDGNNQVLCEISNASTLAYIFDYDGHLHLDLEGHAHPQRFTFGIQFGAHTPNWVQNSGNGIEGAGVPVANLPYGSGVCNTYGFPMFWDGAQLPSISFSSSGGSVSLVGGTAPFGTTMYGLDIGAYLAAVNYFKTHDFLTAAGADSGVPMYANFDGLRNAIATLKQDDEIGVYQGSCTSYGTVSGSAVGSTVNITLGVGNVQTFVNVTSVTGPAIVSTDWINVNNTEQTLSFCSGVQGGYRCGTGGTGIYEISHFYTQTITGTFNLYNNVIISTPSTGAQTWYEAGLDTTAMGYVANTTLVETDASPGVLTIGDRVAASGMQPERITGGSYPTWTVDVAQIYGSVSNQITLSAGQDLACDKDIAQAAVRGIVDLVAMQSAAGTNSLGIVPPNNLSPTQSNAADWIQEGPDCMPAAATVKPPVAMWQLVLFPALYPTNNCTLGWYGTTCGLGLASKVALRLGGGSLCIPGTGCGNGADPYVLQLNAIGALIFDQTNSNGSIPCVETGSTYGNNDHYTAGMVNFAAMVAFQNMQLPNPALEIRNEYHPNDNGQGAPCVPNAWVGHAFHE